MTLQEMREKIDAFLTLGKHWQSEMAQWTPIENRVKGEDGLRLRLFTDRHLYSIVMYPERGEKKSYVGCVMDNRTPLPGESHTRGGDLADGEFTDATLRRIVADILSKEMHPSVEHPDALVIF